MGKNHADAILSFRRQGKAQDVTFTAEKLMRYLYENPCAVAALGIGAFGTTVLQIFQNRQSLVYDIIGFFSFHINDEANAAGIVFKCRIVQPLRCRQIA